MNNEACIVIDGLGGTTAVARMVHAPISTVHSWRINGIPKSRMAHLRLAAGAEGLKWPVANHDEAATADANGQSPGNIGLISSTADEAA